MNLSKNTGTILKSFSVEYKRNIPTRAITNDVEENIIIELSKEKNLIDDPAIPIRNYNYSYIKDMLDEKYANKVSLPTIISRAKKYNFYISKRKKEKTHDREVLTDYAGQLIQHDSSHHKWSPYADDKWYLITSLDDFSRYILYAKSCRKRNYMGSYCRYGATDIKIRSSIFILC